MNVQCIVNRNIKLSDQTGKMYLTTPLAYNNALAHAMRVTVFNEDGTAADLSTVGVTGVFLNASGESISPINGTASGNVAEIILPAICYTTPGRFSFTMNLTDSQSGASRTALWVDGFVERNTSETIIAPGSPVTSIDQAIGQANAAANAANTAATSANDAAGAANTAAGTANTAAGNATSATGAANTAANAANSAATSANSAASAANQAAASVPQFLMDTLFDWYMEEHSGQDTPFTKIASATISGTNLASEIVFDPDTLTYSGSATLTGSTGIYGFYDIVLSNPDAEIKNPSWQKVSGSGTLSVSTTSTSVYIKFSLAGDSSSLVGRLRVPVLYQYNGKTYNTIYALTIGVNRAT